MRYRMMTDYFAALAVLLLCAVFLWIPGIGWSAEEPNSYQLWRTGNTAYSRNQYREALVSLKQQYDIFLAPERDVKYDSYKCNSAMLIGDCYLHLGDYGSAKEWFSVPFRVCPDNTSYVALARYWLGRYHKAQDRDGSAILEWSRGMTDCPNPSRGRALCAIALADDWRAKGDMKKSYSLLQPLIKDAVVKDDAELLEQLARKLLEIGYKQEAKDVFARWTATLEKSLPPDLAAWTRLETCFALRDYKAAVQEASEALRMYPEGRHFSDTVVLLALAYGNLGKPDEAERAVRSRITFPPPSVDVARWLGTLGDIYYKAGRYADALKAFDEEPKWKELPPEKLAKSIYFSGLCRLKLGRTAEGLGTMSRVVVDFISTSWAAKAQSEIYRWSPVSDGAANSASASVNRPEVDRK